MSRLSQPEKPFDPETAEPRFSICMTSRFANSLKGRTERELQLARDEYFRHRSMVEKTRLTEKTFINFLEYLDKTEEMLIDHPSTQGQRKSPG
jgi:hypothetical protein